MLKVSLSLSTDTVVKFLENFIELPIKFLIPYTTSGVLSNLNLLKSFFTTKLIFLSVVSLKDFNNIFQKIFCCGQA